MMATSASARMDRMYRVQRHVYDLTRLYYLLGRKTLIHGLVPPKGGRVLEIGCGTAWNLIRAASAYPDVEFHGIDVSELMLETARRKIARSSFKDRISVTQADATTFSYMDVPGDERFDRVYASYTLSMIPDWRHVLDQAIASTVPGGSVHIIDFGDASGLPEIAQIALKGWLKKFGVVPCSTLRDELAARAANSQSDLFHTDLFRGYAQYSVLTHH